MIRVSREGNVSRKKCEKFRSYFSNFFAKFRIFRKKGKFCEKVFILGNNNEIFNILYSSFWAPPLFSNLCNCNFVEKNNCEAFSKTSKMSKFVMDRSFQVGHT